MKDKNVIKQNLDVISERVSELLILQEPEFMQLTGRKNLRFRFPESVDLLYLDTV